MLSVLLKVFAYGVVPLALAAAGNHLAAQAIQDARTRTVVRVAFFAAAVLGIAVAIVVEMTAENARARDAKAQADAAVMLSTKLTLAETGRQVDTAYLKAKLEDAIEMNRQFGRLAPAILEFAKTTADYSRKQYESKVSSNDQLRSFALDVVKRMRDFEARYRTASREMSDRRFSEMKHAASEAERAAVWEQQNRDYVQAHLAYENEYKGKILGDARYARDELAKRLGLTPAEVQQIGGLRGASIAFEGVLAGPSPVDDAATVLEQLVKRLSP